MAIRFKTTDISFSNVQGQQTETKAVGFDEEVRDAQTAIRAFSFNFRTGDHHIDEVKVSTKASRQGDNVNVDATVIYADKDKLDDFSATVSVLVIADVEEH
jgi:hypothetical protein